MEPVSGIGQSEASSKTILISDNSSLAKLEPRPQMPLTGRLLLVQSIVAISISPIHPIARTHRLDPLRWNIKPEN